MRPMRIGIMISILLFITACSSYVTSRTRSEIPLVSNGRLAILPFENLSDGDRAGEKITGCFDAALSGYGNFSSLEHGMVYESLRRFRIRSTSTITNAQIDSLRSSLGLDYLLVGSVLEYEEHRDAYLGLLPQVAFTCRLIDCSRKRTIWVATANGSGDESEVILGIGAVRSVDALANKMVKEAAEKIADLFPG